MDNIFNNYQFSDGLRFSDYRNCDLFLIGYDGGNELCLIKTWGEMGYGIPIRSKQINYKSKY